MRASTCAGALQDGMCFQGPSDDPHLRGSVSWAPAFAGVTSAARSGLLGAAALQAALAPFPTEHEKDGGEDGDRRDGGQLEHGTLTPLRLNATGLSLSFGWAEMGAQAPHAAGRMENLWINALSD